MRNIYKNFQKFIVIVKASTTKCGSLRKELSQEQERLAWKQEKTRAFTE